MIKKFNRTIKLNNKIKQNKITQIEIEQNKIKNKTKHIKI